MLQIPFLYQRHTILSGKRGKSPGTQVQHTLEIGRKDTEFRHFLASNCGTVWAITKSARTFAPITQLFHQLPLRADCEECLEQQGREQLLGWHRRPPDRRVEL